MGGKGLCTLTKNLFVNPHTPNVSAVTQGRPGAIFDGTRKFQKGVLLSSEFSGGAHFTHPLYLHYIQ